jgi:hypothetical protein
MNKSMLGEHDDDREMLQAIHAHCAAQCRAGEAIMPTAEQRARRRAYEKVARAARELLEEMDA